MKKQLMRVVGNEFCRLEVELRDDGELSICGSYGRIVKAKQAKTEALNYWKSFFEEDRTELHAMNDRCGTSFRTPGGAAKYVLANDGEYHGLDVIRKDGGKVFILETCGQIQDKLKKFFPEVEPYLKWHLNNLHAECEHQEARGETYTTHPGAECPDCRYKLGSAWTKRTLPAEVLEWVDALDKRRRGCREARGTGKAKSSFG